MSLEHKERYKMEIPKPWFLKSGYEYYATETVGKDCEFFRERFGGTGEGSYGGVGFGSRGEFRECGVDEGLVETDCSRGDRV